SWRDGNNHLYLYGFDPQNPLAGEAAIERQLTAGNYQDSKVLAITSSSQAVYFTATAEDPRPTHLYSVNQDGSAFSRRARAPGTYSALFSPHASQYVLNYSSLQSPPQLSLCGSSGECSPIWESTPVAPAALAQAEELELKADDGTTTLFGRLLLPRGAKDAP